MLIAVVIVERQLGIDVGQGERRWSAKRVALPGVVGEQLPEQLPSSLRLWAVNLPFPTIAIGWCHMSVKWRNQGDPGMTYAGQSISATVSGSHQCREHSHSRFVPP
jgi:hypothetical protein